MEDNYQINVENAWIVKIIDRLLFVFIADIPEPISYKGSVDYTNTLQEFSNRLHLIVKINNYIHETKTFRSGFENRLKVEQVSKKMTYALSGRKKLSHHQQMTLGVWFNIIQGLSQIEKTMKGKPPEAIQSKVRAFMYSATPVLASYITKLEERG